MERPILRTARLLLVPQTRVAAAALLEGADSGHLLGEGYPHADSFDALRLLVAEGAEEPAGWFVLRADDGRVIGDCGTIGWKDESGRVEIGYGLAAPSRGLGYGTELVQALVGWVGAQPGVRAVTAAVEVGNVASRRLLERLGFRLVATADRHWQFEREVT